IEGRRGWGDGRHRVGFLVWAWVLSTTGIREVNPSRRPRVPLGGGKLFDQAEEQTPTPILGPGVFLDRFRPSLTHAPTSCLREVLAEPVAEALAELIDTVGMQPDLVAPEDEFQLIEGLVAHPHSRVHPDVLEHF